MDSAKEKLEKLGISFNNIDHLYGSDMNSLNEWSTKRGIVAWSSRKYELIEGFSSVEIVDYVNGQRKINFLDHPMWSKKEMLKVDLEQKVRDLCFILGKDIHDKCVLDSDDWKNIQINNRNELIRSWSFSDFNIEYSVIQLSQLYSTLTITCIDKELNLDRLREVKRRLKNTATLFLTIGKYKGVIDDLDESELKVLGRKIVFECLNELCEFYGNKHWYRKPEVTVSKSLGEIQLTIAIDDQSKIPKILDVLERYWKLNIRDYL